MTTPTWGAGNGASTTGDTGDTVRQAADTARSEGTEVAHTAVEAGGQVASTAADATKEVAGEARRQAKDLFGEARTQLHQQAGATQRQAAGGVRSVADELRQMAGAGDGGPVADLAHQAAGRADDLAGWLEQREPGDLVEREHGQRAVGQRHRPGRGGSGIPRLRIEPGVGPRAERPVEQTHVRDAGVPQQPPGARAREVLEVVVDHHGVAVIDAPAPGRLLQRLDGRERMPPVGGLPVRGELVVEVDVLRAGDVPGAVLGQPVGSVEAPAHVEHAHGTAVGETPRGEGVAQFGRGDQDVRHARAPPRDRGCRTA